MRFVLVTLVLGMLTACSKTPGTSAAAEPADPAVVQYLLTSAATDFRTHPPEPARFRNVSVGHGPMPSGERQYRICGEFLPEQEDGKAEWTPFATIKTSGYEQYIGGGPGEMAYCGDKVVWEKGDLSAALQGKFDSLAH